MRTPAPRRLVVLGAVGSCLLAVGAFGVGAVPARLGDTWLHDSDVGRALSTVMCASGVLALLWAWWRLRGSTPQVLLLAAAAWALPLLVAPPLFSRDVYAYAGQAHLVTLGIDPYTHGPAAAPGPLSAEVDGIWSHARSPYGPVFLRLASWLLPGEHVVTAVLLERVLPMVGLALLAWALVRLTKDSRTALWLAVANPLVLLHGIGGVHNDLLMAGLLASGLAIAVSAARSGRRVAFGLAAGAAVITVAVLVKAPAVAALAFLPFVVTTARLRAAVVVAVTAVAVAVSLTAATGLGWGWVHTLDAGNPRRSLLSVSTGAGVLVSNIAGDGALDVAHAIGLCLAGLIGLGLLVRAARIGALLALGLTLLAVVVLGPVVQPWYLIWVLAVLGGVAGERLATGLGVACAVACLLILPGGRHVIRPPLYGVPALAVIAAGYAAARIWDPEAAGAGRVTAKDA